MAFHQPQDSMYLTEAEYLATEPGSAVKREYIDGKVYASPEKPGFLSGIN